jgi:hypothetical protein
MLRDMAAYGKSLEAFSAGIAPFARYRLDLEQRMQVVNQTADLYRYFDATPQAEYLFGCIEETLRQDLKQELGFLAFFDLAMRSVMEIVDMPGQRASLLIRLIHQNQGRLSRTKRNQFAELTEEEIMRIEGAIQVAARESGTTGSQFPLQGERAIL